MSVLTRIFDTKRTEVEQARATMPDVELTAIIADMGPMLGFRNALKDGKPPHHLALIAEVKKASPSKGIIRENFDAADVAAAYKRAGVSALSVLTDEQYFQGHPENIAKAKKASGLPALRKDFIFDHYQLLQARAWGADAVLLIVAGLDDDDLKRLYDGAAELGLDVLVEVHTDAEAERAIALGANIIGVNNRDLGDFKTDVSISERILPMLPSSVIKVSESALETSADLERVRAAGADVVLIGTTFCAAPDIESKVREVMGW